MQRVKIDTGWTNRQLDNILFIVNDATIEEAVNILLDLSFAGDLYDRAGSMDLREYAAAFRGEMLAIYADGITFQGGPTGKDWYTGNLQMVCTDWVLQCCRDWGVDNVQVGLKIV